MLLNYLLTLPLHRNLKLAKNRVKDETARCTRNSRVNGTCSLNKHAEYEFEDNLKHIDKMQTSDNNYSNHGRSLSLNNLTVIRGEKNLWENTSWKDPLLSTNEESFSPQNENVTRGCEETCNREIASGSQLRKSISLSTINDAKLNGILHNKNIKQRKGFIKQIFQNKSKDREMVKKGLWSVVHMVKGIAPDITQTGHLPGTNHTYDHPPSEHNTDKTTTPIILINGVHMPDTIDEEIEEELNRRNIENIFDHLDSNCCVSGDGIISGVENEPNIFFAQTENNFDKEKLHVSIKGPKQQAMRTESELVEFNRCQFTYWPRRTGYYTIYVRWEGKHVIGSPFIITVN